MWMCSTGRWQRPYIRDNKLLVQVVVIVLLFKLLSCKGMSCAMLLGAMIRLLTLDSRFCHCFSFWVAIWSRRSAVSGSSPCTRSNGTLPAWQGEQV